MAPGEFQPMVGPPEKESFPAIQTYPIFAIVMSNAKTNPTTSAWEEAERAGCDMSLIEANLELTYQQRCEQHDNCANAVQTLRQAATAQIDGLSRANFDGLIKAKSELSRAQDILTVQKLRALQERLRNDS